MIIKLTNAVKEYEGKKFLLNSDIIATVYEGLNEDGKPAVFVFSQNEKTWQVKETVAQVEKLLKA
jgi:hypothetical protein